jgi:hypothetical protein
MKVFVTYDSPEALERAIALCKQFENDPSEVTWWGYSYLQDACIREAAIATAADSDVILLASDSEELPKEVRNWFEDSLLQRRKKSGAFVALWKNTKASRRIAWLAGYLKERISSKGMQFFAPIPKPCIA